MLIIGPDVPRSGVVRLHLEPADAGGTIEVARAPDVVSADGESAPGAFVSSGVYEVPPEGRTVEQRVEGPGVRLWFTIRHVRPGFLPSSWLPPQLVVVEARGDLPEEG